MSNIFDIAMVGGCGHVGLPLGIAFAEAGKKVVLCDVNRDSVEKVNRKEMPFLEKRAPEALAHVVDSGMLMATTDKSVISRSDCVLLVVGTPLDEHLNPRVSEIIKVIEEIADLLDENHLVVLRSTIYPGVTRKIQTYLANRLGRAAVAFCPERIAEGSALEEITRLPQIISACDPQTLERVKSLFKVLGTEIIELSPEEAELAKLFTNAWRYISFAISNQFYMIAENFGHDFYKIYGAMVKSYPRLQGFAKAGFTAGPCLLKDTLQLSSFSKNIFFLGHAAMLINEGLPSFIVGQLKTKTSISDKVVGILGMTFKADHDDLRDSLSFKLKKILELEAKSVLCSDFYIQEPSFLKASDLVKQSDVVILATPHKAYESLDLTGKIVVDVWNFFQKNLSNP
jgi:UDP-N-acetyl-D-mannosaminuronic acid dehydrogenase